MLDPFVRIEARRVQGGGAAGLQHRRPAAPVRRDQDPEVHPRPAAERRAAQDVNGGAYVEFRLDINQKSSQPYLSLDQMRVYVADAPNLTGYNAATGKLAGLAAVYNMDGGGDAWVKLDARLSTGSGSGDMVVDVPLSAFAGSGDNPYVYLYSLIGEHYAGASGFQEWAVAPGTGTPIPTPPPPPGPTPPPSPGVTPASLSGSVFMDYNGDGIREAGEDGLQGVTVTLTGTDNQGHAVTATAVTDGNGDYTFTGVAPGPTAGQAPGVRPARRHRGVGRDGQPRDRRDRPGPGHDRQHRAGQRGRRHPLRLRPTQRRLTRGSRRRRNNTARPGVTGSGLFRPAGQAGRGRKVGWRVQSHSRGGRGRLGRIVGRWPGIASPKKNGL